MLHKPEPLGWTPQRVTLLRKLWAEGLSGEEIAIELGGGLTRNAVIGKAHRLKLNPRAPRKNDRRRPGKGHKPEPVAIIGAPGEVLPVGRPVKVLPVSDELPDVTDRIGLLQLTEHTCKYPYGDEHPFKFCGKPSIEGSPYCAKHDRRCHNLRASLDDLAALWGIIRRSRTEDVGSFDNA